MMMGAVVETEAAATMTVVADRALTRRAGPVSDRISQSAAGEEAVWRAARSELVGFVRPRVKDDASAEDIVHDVLVRAYTRRDELQHPHKLRAWLYQITRNALADHYRLREKRRFEPLRDDLPDPGPD